MVLVWFFFAVLQLHLAASFYPASARQRGSILNAKSAVVSAEDPYADMLNLEREAPANAKDTLYAAVSISSAAGEGVFPANATVAPPSKASTSLLRVGQKKWEHWDAWMEREFGDMDAELEEKDKWMLELRDIVEQKRGFAIWSKRSEKEIQREVKKNLANKALQVPESVARIIRAVYLDKTHTMKEMKKEDELACINYRKWMMEQRSKTKKDPLPGAKMEVSKAWMLRNPSNTASALQRQKGEFPAVVMDECMEPVPGVAFASESGSAKTSSASSSTMITTSMVNWDKSLLEIAATPLDLTVAAEEARGSLGLPSSTSFGSSSSIFRVDNEEIFVATSPPGQDYEFFVVI